MPSLDYQWAAWCIVQVQGCGDRKLFAQVEWLSLTSRSQTHGLTDKCKISIIITVSFCCVYDNYYNDNSFLVHNNYVSFSMLLKVFVTVKQDNFVTVVEVLKHMQSAAYPSVN